MSTPAAEEQQPKASLKKWFVTRLQGALTELWIANDGPHSAVLAGASTEVSCSIPLYLIPLRRGFTLNLGLGLLPGSPSNHAAPLRTLHEGR